MKRYFLVILAMYISWHVSAQEVGSVTVHISEVNEVQGYMMIAVYDSAEHFLSKELVAGAKVEVSTETVVYEFPDLPFGKYAISVYHDVDSDGRLDTNFIGIPKEPYGFSNNDMGLFGAPSYDRAVFLLQEKNHNIQITLKGG